MLFPTLIFITSNTFGTFIDVIVPQPYMMRIWTSCAFVVWAMICICPVIAKIVTSDGVPARIKMALEAAHDNYFFFKVAEFISKGC